MALKLGFDLDGVICNFTGAYAELLTEHTGIVFPHLDPTFPATWYWERDGGVTPEQEAFVWNNHILHENSKFWERLEPMEGAVEALKLLNKLSNKRLVDVYYLTHRHGHGTKQQTERWLYDHHMHYPTVLLAGNKLPIINALGIEAFIDDKPETIGEVSQGSIARVYIKSAPYNEYVHEDHRITRVATVMDMLKLEGLV